MLKQQRHSGHRTRLYYWRSRGGAEVDLILQEGGRYRAFEIKHNPKKRPRFPKAFVERYAPEQAEVVNVDTIYRILGRGPEWGFAAGHGCGGERDT
jgi:predicted AAA+ superfamily ATPase